MFGWLKAKAQKKAADTMRDELERFLESLKGIFSYEIAGLLLTATRVRLNLIQSGIIPATSLDLSKYKGSVKEDWVAYRINRIIRSLQKEDQLSDAAGAIVWLHSVRALQTPEIRLLGRRMWKELSRGFPMVDEAAEDLTLVASGVSIDVVAQAMFVPVGLEPNVD